MDTTYNSLLAKLGTRERRKLENNTYLEKRENGSIAIKLHATDVLTYTPDGRVAIDTGGWRTLTTKERINRYAPKRVYQSKGQWFWQSGQPFTEGDWFDAQGELHAQSTPAKQNEERELRKRILAYSKLYAALPLPKPSGGDCWYCAMRDVSSGQPLGECTHNTDHLTSHMDEKYVVPSLAARAMENAGAGVAWFSSVFNGDFMKDAAAKQLPRWIRKYMYRQFGLAA